MASVHWTAWGWPCDCMREARLTVSPTRVNLARPGPPSQQQHTCRAPPHPHSPTARVHSQRRRQGRATAHIHGPTAQGPVDTARVCAGQEGESRGEGGGRQRGGGEGPAERAGMELRGFGSEGE